MSDNVVLSKHFDSLASAIQRCLSAGYAPTAYIPAGHDCVIDSVASTVDGGMWYELNGRVPIIKMHYGDYDFEFNTIAPLDAYKVFDLRTLKVSPHWQDLCGNEWVYWDGGYRTDPYEGQVPTRGVNFTVSTPIDRLNTGGNITFLIANQANKGFTLNENLLLGGKDFTVRFWYVLYSDFAADIPIMAFSTETDEDAFAIHSINDTENYQGKFSVKIFSDTYQNTTTYTLSRGCW